MKDKHIETFKQEAFELLEVLEASLIDLESDPGNEEVIGKVFRSLHTIKGGGGMFGFDEVASFVHNIETVYDKIRNREIPVSNEIIDFTLKAKDQIHEMIKYDKKDIENDQDVQGILKFFSGFLDINNTVESSAPVPSSDREAADGSLLVFHIYFEPFEDLFLKGTRPTGLLSELAGLGETVILPSAEKIPYINEINPESFYTSWNIFLSTEKDINTIKDVFIFVEDDCKLLINKIDEGSLKGNAEYYRAVLESKTAPGEKKTTVKAGEPQKPGSHASKTNSKKERQPGDKESTGSIRVSSDKLDLLVDLVGELVTVQARLAQTANTNDIPELVSISEDVERLTWELRENALNIRMLPIGSTFNKFNRLVRDLSKELGKEVELVANGGETELDKNVIEKLNEPLVHIIRNCIDHGIEKPEVRLEKNKERSGRVYLSAMHSGTHVIIEIKDDGAGLNRQAIFEKAVERGLVPPDSELSDKEIFALIFNAGFSTAKTVTNVSGRGVGMDVVRSAIESLRGIIEVESREDEWTKIILKLPLTLAIIEGLIVRIDTEYFVIPLSFVEECIELTSQKKKESNGRNILNVRSEIIPYIPLRRKFKLYDNQPDIEQVVIVRNSNMKAGLVVDEIIGEHQTVIKSLGKYYRNVEVMSGATVLGDGTVALIVDISKLLNMEIKEEERHYHKVSLNN
jgi:two-component system chemotaxis sensor kinase CheA